MSQTAILVKEKGVVRIDKPFDFIVQPASERTLQSRHRALYGATDYQSECLDVALVYVYRAGDRNGQAGRT